jgi:hypothetical protein
LSTERQPLIDDEIDPEKSMRYLVCGFSSSQSEVNRRRSEDNSYVFKASVLEWNQQHVSVNWSWDQTCSSRTATKYHHKQARGLLCPSPNRDTERETNTFPSLLVYAGQPIGSSFGLRIVDRWCCSRENSPKVAMHSVLRTALARCSEINSKEPSSDRWWVTSECCRCAADWGSLSVVFHSSCSLREWSQELFARLHHWVRSYQLLYDFSGVLVWCLSVAGTI